MTTDLSFERRHLAGSADHEDALLGQAANGRPEAGANVLRAMINQLGLDEKVVMSEERRLARQAVIFELAGRLGIASALKELYERPLPERGRQGLEPDGRGDVAYRGQVAIVEFLDSFSYRSHSLY